MKKKIIINILLPLPFNQTFQYLCDEKEKIELGSFVVVPFKDKDIIGCVWDSYNQQKGKISLVKIKNIKNKLNFTPLNEENRNFINWVSNYTMNKLGSVL